MKKTLIYSTCAALTLSSCYSTGQGAYAGASLGSIIGSAIGGINGGPRGSDMGTLIGMAGGAIVGAAIGNASEKAQASEYQRHKEEIYGRHDEGDGSGFDPNNGGDDRIEFDGGAPSTPSHPTMGEATLNAPAREVSLHGLADMGGEHQFKLEELTEMRNASFTDESGDGALQAGETGKVVFEIMNNAQTPLLDVVPTVAEATGNKHIHISPSIRVESIAPHQGVRYTATIWADRRLKDGSITLKATATQNGNEIIKQAKVFTVKTSRK